MIHAFTTSDINSIYGFTQRQLDSWDRSGIIKPSIRPSRGKGSQRLYSFEDLLAFRFIKRLQDAGWHIRTIKTAIQNLQEILPDKNPLYDLVLFDVSGRILARCSTETGQSLLIDALSQGQLVMAVLLSTIQREVIRDVVALEAA